MIPETRQRFSLAGILRMFVTGALVGSFFDGFHTHSGTTNYPHPIVWMMAWWTPLLFGGVYALLGVLYALGHPSVPTRAAGREELILGAFGLLYFASGYLPAANGIKLGVLLSGGLALWAGTDRTVPTLALGLLAAVLGPATEMVFVWWGIFHHLQPDVLGVPIWLPALYFASAAGAGPSFAKLGLSPEPARTQAEAAR